MRVPYDTANAPSSHQTGEASPVKGGEKRSGQGVTAGAACECEASSSCFTPATHCWSPGGGVAEQTDSAGLDSSVRGPSIVFCSFDCECLLGRLL